MCNSFRQSPRIQDHPILQIAKSDSRFLQRYGEALWATCLVLGSWHNFVSTHFLVTPLENIILDILITKIFYPRQLPNWYIILFSPSLLYQAKGLIASAVSQLIVACYCAAIILVKGNGVGISWHHNCKHTEVHCSISPGSIPRYHICFILRESSWSRELLSNVLNYITINIPKSKQG